MVKSNMAKDISKFAETPISDAEIFDSVVDKMRDAKGLANYHGGDDFRPYGKQLSEDNGLMGDYMSTLAVQYGIIFQKIVTAQNPLSEFKRGTIPFGGSIESVIYPIVQPKLFNPNYRDKHGAHSPFEQEPSNPIGGTYRITQNITSKTTIYDTIDNQYFLDLAQFNDYIYGKIAALIDGAINDEYIDSALALSQSMVDHQLPTYNLKPSDATKLRDRNRENAEQLVRTIKEVGKNFKYYSNKYNTKGILQATNNICVIVPVKDATNIDVSFLSQIFNPENARERDIQYIEIASFPDIWRYSKDHVVTEEDGKLGYLDVISAENPRGRYAVGEVIPKGRFALPEAPDAVEIVNGNKVSALVLDRDALQLWDQLPLRLSALSDPEHRSVNVFLNKKTYIQFIAGLNAEAIMMDESKPEGDVTFPDVNDTPSSDGSNSSDGTNTGSNPSNGSTPATRSGSSK